jgi:hypothetical protein
MSRTIKFRGDRIDGSGWVFGDLIHCKGITLTGLRDKVCIGDAEVSPETVGQFIGLHDATRWQDLTEPEREIWTRAGNTPDEWKGREIYEGDIFTVNGKYPKTVRFIDERASFCVANIDELEHEYRKDIWQQPSPVRWSDFRREIIVVGNIHDGAITDATQTNTSKTVSQ